MHLKNKSQYFAALTFDKYVKFRSLRLFLYKLFNLNSFVGRYCKEV
jgi:hypothetical protein